MHEAEGFLRLQQSILERIALGEDLDATLDALCRFAEGLVDGAVCSVLRLDPQKGTLHVASAPSAPQGLAAALDGLVPGELAGSCGAAVHRREAVVVEDTHSDPRWQGLLDVARRFAIRSCWSIPFSSRGEILGTFGISRGTVGGPSNDEFQLLQTAGYLAGIAMDRDRRSSELREQRALLDSIIESSEDPIFAKDRAGRYLLANSAEARGLRDDRMEFVGLEDRDLYPPEVADACRKIDLEILSTGRGCHYEQEFDNPLLGRRVYLVHKSPLVGGDGAPRGVVGIARDVTERKRAEEAMRRVQKLESLGVMAGGLAHDFNNLLTGILGNAELALDVVPASSPARSNLLDIRHAVVRAAELVDQMLTYAGKAERAASVIRLPELVGETLGLLATSISKKARLRVSADPALPNLEADPMQIRQLLMNTILNASEALEDAAGEIEISMRPVELDHAAAGPFEDRVGLPPGRYVVLEVADTGVGMDEATLARIFDPFFTTKFAGRGLGLAAVQGIVHSHGGAIDVRSRPGAGTRFLFYLPASDRPLAAEPGAAPSSSWRGSGTVLVVDDEEPVRSLAARVLERAGFTVATAVDGEAAIAILRNERPAAVLLDLTTPGLEGSEVVRRLRAVRPDVPVVLSSGYGEPRTIAEVSGEPLAGFLKKPYRPAELVAAVRKAIEERSPREAGPGRVLDPMQGPV